VEGDRSTRDPEAFSTPGEDAGSIADAKLLAFDSACVPMKWKGSRGAVYLAIANTMDRHKKRAPRVRARSRLKFGEHRRHNNPSIAKLMLLVLIGSPQAEQNRVRRIDPSPVRRRSTGASIGINRD
jgi:hypothetical protein